jgi:4-hydroxy-tetrahydrodipicolinate synthase
MNPPRVTGGVWSATPTPLTADRRIDEAAVARMVHHHVKLGVTGIMLAGTCGEGPWLRPADKEALTRAAVAANAGRLRIAVQVTDNSAGRVLENIERAAEWGAEIAVVDAPWFFLNNTPERRLAHHREIVRRSALPAGLYDRGKHSPNAMPESHLAELLAEPNIVMVKDSSQSAERRAIHLAARAARPGLVLLNGDEFDCVNYLKAGYDGLLLGGGVFNARIARRLLAAVRADDLAAAEREQARMSDLMLRVYGGAKIECWLTGLKELLVRMGVFGTNTNLLDYPLTESCRAQIIAALDGSDGMGYREDLLGRMADMSTPTTSELPYVDTKPQGSPDFYYAINATFRFILKRLGREAWVRYLEEMGRGYFAPVNARWRAGGLPAVARYWRAFFAAEPGAVVTVEEQSDRVELVVRECPAIRHLRAGGREIVKEYCQHCYFLGQARAEAAGLTMRLAGGDGACRHTYARAEAPPPPQDMAAIKEAGA